MENSTWQSKCGPPVWLPSTASLPSSSQFPSQPPQNQVQSLLPQQELISSHLRVAQEAMLSWNSDLNLGNLGFHDLGRSNLSPLMCRPSLPEWDLQPTQKFIACCDTPVNSNKPDGSATGIALPLLSSDFLKSSLGRLNEETGADVSSSFSSKAGSAKCGARWGLNNVLPSASLNNFQKSEQLLPVINQKVSSTESSKALLQLREGSFSLNMPGNIGNFHNSFGASSAPSSACPRVFCFGISGYLLSRNGLLGVVCSCHGIHMSVSNFTEHSGLCNADPGHAVLLDSGETIAQWRKDYLRKFGISAPGDHIGWNWSGGFRVTASDCSPSFPVTPISSDVSFQVSSLGALPFSGQYSNNVFLPEHPKYGGHVVDKIPHDEKRSKRLQGHDFPFKGLNSTSLSNCDFVTDKKFMSHSVTGGSAIPHSVGVRSTVNDCQSASDYNNSNSKLSSSFIPYQDMQNPKRPRRCCNVMNSESLVMYQDSGSSNIELRLGQPSVQRQTLESQLASGSNQILGPSEAKSSELPGQLHKLADSKVGMSEYKREDSRFHKNHFPGCFSSPPASQADKYEGTSARISAIPALLSHIKHAENVHPDASKIVMNHGNAMVGKELCGFHIAKGNNFVPWVRGRRMDKEFSGNELYGENKNCEGVGGGQDNSITAAKQDSYATKLKRDSFLNEVVGESGCNKSFLEDRSLNTRQFSGMKANATDAKWLQKISYPEHHLLSGNEFPRRVCSLGDSGAILASQAVSAASSCRVLNPSHGPIPALPNNWSIDARQGFVHDSPQKFASQHLLELANHSASLETIPGQCMFSKYCDKEHDSISSSASKGQCYGYYCACTLCSSGVASESQASPLGYLIVAENEKLAPVADLTKHFNCSELSKGKSFPTGGAKLQSELSRVTYLTEQPLLRFSGNKDEIKLPNLPEKCFHAEPCTNFQGKGCAMGTHGLEKSYDFKDKTSVTASKELAGTGTSRPTSQVYACPNERPSYQGIGLQEMGCTSFQWRDVPKKMEEISSKLSKELPACSVGGNRGDAKRNPNAEAANANCFNTAGQDAESQKEQEVSGISSCSAPVTQISIGIDDSNSPTVDAVDMKYGNNLVVDEASGVDRCCSSDEALGSEQSAGFLGFVSTSNSMDVGQTDRVLCGSSCSHIDEIRLGDSLRLNQMQNPCPSFTIQEKRNHGKTIELCSRKRKRRRTIKWKRLNASFPPSSQSFTYKGSPKLGGSRECHSYAFKDAGLLLGNGQRSSSVSVCACFAEPFSKPRKSALSSAICHEKDFQQIHHRVDADIHNQTKKKINRDVLGDTEVIRRKRSTLVSAEPTTNEMHINELSVVDAGKAETSFGNQVTVSKKFTKPMVCGKYGIISNGNPLKPAKIVCMKRILTATECDSVSAHAKWHIGYLKSKKSNTTKCDGCFTKPSSVQETHSRFQDRETNRDESSLVLSSELNRQGSLGELRIVSLKEGKETEGLSCVMNKKRSHGRCGKNGSATKSCLRTRLKPKSKGIRKRSLYELTISGKGSGSSNFSIDAMSAFGVSGASLSTSNVVCSICTRLGGSCIKCRVADCSVYFHPWCARQKSLLQSEVEGVNEENTCLYGQCMNHATCKQSNSDDHLAERKKEFTCARTEGFKGCKRDGSQHMVPRCPDSNNGCHVPQEQLNAWLHINGQRPFPSGQPKLLKLEIEHDHRKEYARYKQSKGWKHLVVYKSGIHGLGLYTCRFISRGAMVVEYVGEVVGPRVADRRESEYQSGKRLQYKSACYFFRVDKEHIIDATRKGGIARFVNHSCSPNCVAEVISIRNEKKVVFFAEREIYPGEEITYDYHFNREDEGKKIPCFCNSKNCRRYLN